MTTGVRITQPPGPLAVSSTNPRYFTAAAAPAAAVYLTGSHVNNNLHDGLGMGIDCPQEPERFDFDAYLELLTERGHNFIRLWRWEQFRGQLAQANVHFCMTPQPWPRTGPGSAKDGKPRFDLSAFDQSYFDRIRERVLAAGRAGIYASVMLFEGFSLPDYRSGQHRGPSVPCREQRQRHRNHLDRRLSGSAPRSPCRGAPAGLHPQCDRHRS